MKHSPIVIQSISLSFLSKTCLSNFSTRIVSGSRIALVGQNGSGKSSFLKLLQGELRPDQGTIVMPKNIVVGSVPQLITAESLSGAELFNKALTQAITPVPQLLLLDEPTNHLDQDMKKSLIKMLQSFKGTVVLATHDEELLRSFPEEIWHFEDGIIRIFSGSYDAYINELEHAHNNQVSTVQQLKKKHGKLKQTIDYDQQARAHRRKAHKKENDRSLRKLRKEHASKSMGTVQGKLNQQKNAILAVLETIKIPEVIVPTFNIRTDNVSKKHTIIIQDGSCGYDMPILSSIHIIIQPGDRVSVTGNNGSGKTTLLKAIMHDPHVTRLGTWTIPDISTIGYLDQHYRNLHDDDTVRSTIEAHTPTYTANDRRKLLSTFLFRTQEAMETHVGNLSGGEKARLSLACIAAQNPPILIVDEITNNLDRETKEHVLQLLNAYTGTLLVVSHDEELLTRLSLTHTFDCKSHTYKST